VVKDIKALSLNVEYLTLSADVFMLIRLNLTIDEIKQGWMISAKHRDEASRVSSISTCVFSHITLWQWPLSPLVSIL
jgi:hypothetical protein